MNPNLIRHLAYFQRDALKFACKGVAREEVSQFVQNVLDDAPFKGSLWEKNPGFNYKRWPLVAFKALDEGSVPESVFTTTCLLSACCGEFAYNIHHFDYDSFGANSTLNYQISSAKSQRPFDQRCFRVIAPGSPDYEKYYLHLTRTLTQEGSDELTEGIEKLPFHDQQLFVFDLPRGPISSWSDMYSLLVRSLQNTHFHMLHPIEEEVFVGSHFVQRRELVLCALEVYHLFLNVISDDSGLRQKFVPVIGELTEKNVADYQSNFSRVIGVGIPDVVPVHKHADGHFVGPASFSFHDIYHAFRNQSRTYRLWVALNRVVHLLYQRPQVEQDLPEMKHLRSLLIDAESFTPYLEEVGDMQNMFSFFFQGPDAKSLWAKFPEAKRMIFRDMAHHPVFWEPLLKFNGLCVEDREFLSEVKKTLSIDSIRPIPIDYDAHFGFPDGFSETMALFALNTGDPKEEPEEIVAALYQLHGCREVAQENQKRFASYDPKPVFSYAALAKLWSTPSKELFDDDEADFGLLIKEIYALDESGRELLSKLIVAVPPLLNTRLIQRVAKWLQDTQYESNVRNFFDVITTKLQALLICNFTATASVGVLKLICGSADRFNSHLQLAHNSGVDFLHKGFMSVRGAPTPFMAYRATKESEFVVLADGPKERLAFISKVLTLDSKQSKPRFISDANVVGRLIMHILGMEDAKYQLFAEDVFGAHAASVLLLQTIKN